MCAFTAGILLLFRSVPIQICAQLILTLGIGLYGIVITRYAVLYFPTHLFGTVTGLLFFIMSLAMGVGFALVGAVLGFLPSGIFAQYQAPFLVLGVGTLSTTSLCSSCAIVVMRVIHKLS